MKINPLQAVALAATLANELDEASRDGKIDLAEVVSIVLKVAPQMGLLVNTDGVDLSKI